MALLGFDALGRLALGQIESVAAGQGNLTQAVGIGVAGTIGSAVDKGLTGVAGIGVVGIIIANPAVLLIGVAGTGVAGSISDKDDKTLTGVAGIGVAGTITASLQAFMVGTAGIGVAGLIGSGPSTGLVGVSGTGVAHSLTPSVFAFITQAVGIGIAGSLAGPNVPPPDAPFFGGYDGLVSARFALGQITGNRFDGGISISVVIPAAIGIGQAGSFTPTGITGLVGVAGIGVAGQITANPAALLIGVAGIGVAGQITIVISGGGGSAASGDGDRPRRKRPRTGLEPIAKVVPTKPAAPKPIPLPPDWLGKPTSPPLAPAEPLEFTDPEFTQALPGIAATIMDAQDISDIGRYLTNHEQDEQDINDIADVLAMLETQE